MPRRLFSAAAAGALLLGLAACGDGEEGTVTTPPPSINIDAPSDGGGDSEPSDEGGETEEPTAAAPDIPPPDPADYAGMDEQTPEGAEQAFRYYIAVSMWAHQTGDAKLLGELESQECGGCSYLNSDIPESRDSGLLWTLSSVSEVSLSVADASNFTHEVRYKFTLGPHSRADSEFNDRIDVDTLQYDAVGGMDWSSDHWIVSEMSVEWGEDVH